ncbi:MAG: hypothetical protein JO108_32960 [Acidobacteriaceae bacterium]|nr:hypothetical protein [Acidobacteriaceae bacterium]
MKAAVLRSANANLVRANQSTENPGGLDLTGIPINRSFRVETYDIIR